MATPPENIFKEVELATEALEKALSLDVQIIEDNLKYSAWTSGLAVLFIGFIVPKYDEFRPVSLTLLAFVIALSVIVITLFSCLAMGGVHHWQAKNQLALIRKKITLVFRQRSA